MTSDFRTALMKATSLTRSGDLTEATALIQRTLGWRPVRESGSKVRFLQSDPQSFEEPKKRRIKSDLSEQVQDAEVVADEPVPPKPRLPLGALVNHLAARQKSSRPVDLAVPGGATFKQRHFRSQSGERDYYLYTPATARSGIRGLVLMLHGCTQSPTDFALGTGMNEVADTHGLLVAYPAQTRGDNVSLCWNWFRPEDQKRGSGEPDVLAGIAKELQAEHRLGRDQTFVAGLSAGGAMAAILGTTYPDIFAAVGIHSGVNYSSASDATSAFAAMRGVHDADTQQLSKPSVRTILFHGTKDAVVHPSNADSLRSAALGGTKGYEALSHAIAINGRSATRTDYVDSVGQTKVQDWRIDDAGHCWSGGNSQGSHTDSTGPNASFAMVNFFLGRPTS